MVNGPLVQNCRGVRHENGPFQATNLPHLRRGRIHLPMKSITCSLVLAGVLAATSVTAASAEATDFVAVPEEFAIEAERLVEATAALFADLERDQAPSMRKRQPVIGIPQPVGFTAVTEAVEDRPDMDHLRAYRVSWYPVETLLGTVDFVGTYDGGRNLVCGYVTWNLDDPEETEMVALQTNLVDLESLSALPHGERHLALIEANCAFGEIEPNFALSLTD